MFFAAVTMDATNSRLCIKAAPRVSAHAHDCGHPQLISMPLTYGASRVVAREISSGELQPNWTIVGGAVGDVVKSAADIRLARERKAIPAAAA